MGASTTLDDVDEFGQTRIPFREGIKNSIDANTINDSGVYSVGNPGNNFPTVFTGGVLIVLKSTYSMQIVFREYESSSVFFRFKYGNGSWNSKWTQIK